MQSQIISVIICKMVDEKVNLTPESAFQKFYDACEQPKPTLTPEQFGQLPETRQVATLQNAAHFNPGFWAENVVGTRHRIRFHEPKVMTIADVPQARITTSEGEILI